MAWNGKWVNYWTKTVPIIGQTGREVAGSEIGEDALTGSQVFLQPSTQTEGSISSAGSSVVSLALEGGDQGVDGDSGAGIEDTQHPKPEKEQEKDTNAKRPDKKRKAKKGRHFVVRPSRTGAEKWELVTIEGVNDEVAAHCGLFIRGQNLDYEGLIARVGQKIVDWCQGV